MRVTILFLLPALALAAPEKRFVVDSLTGLISIDALKKDLQLMIDFIGSNPSEQACEKAGHKYLVGLIEHSVPLICHSFQELVHHFQIVPATTTAAPVKRFILDDLAKIVSLDALKKDVQMMLDVIGSDPTEQACEQAGRTYLKGLLVHSVPLICHSFQELVGHFNIVPDTMTTAAT